MVISPSKRMGFERVMLGDRSQTPKDVECVHVHEVSKVGKSIDIESR